MIEFCFMFYDASKLFGMVVVNHCTILAFEAFLLCLRLTILQWKIKVQTRLRKAVVIFYPAIF